MWARVWQRDPDCTGIIDKALADKAGIVRSAALRFIAAASADNPTLKGQFGSQFYQTALRSLANSQTVSAAAEALAAMRPPGCAKLLMTYVEGPWSRKQLGAVIALGIMREHNAAKLIVGLVDRITSPIGRMFELFIGVVGPLTRVPGRRLGECLNALISIKSDPALECIDRLLQTPDSKLRLWVVRAFLRTRTADTQKYLQTAIRSGNSSLAQTIEQISRDRRIHSFERYVAMTILADARSQT